MVSTFFNGVTVKTGNTYFMAKTAKKPYTIWGLNYTYIQVIYLGVPLLMQRGHSFYEITPNDCEINIWKKENFDHMIL